MFRIKILDSKGGLVKMVTGTTGETAQGARARLLLEYPQHRVIIMGEAEPLDDLKEPL